MSAICRLSSKKTPTVVVALLGFFSGCLESPVSVVLRCLESPTIHYGEATYYSATGTGACMLDSLRGDMMIGAINASDYAGSQMCGASVVVSGPKGTITISIVDLCPDCPAGDIDLSQQAFERIADPSVGRVPISWYVTESSVIGPIVYHFMEESSQYWTAVQIRNIRYPVNSVEYLTSRGAWEHIGRTNYNYFVAPAGLGKGPYAFRVTDIYGHSLVDSAIALLPGRDVSGHAQFPKCLP
jgi:expansin (peptidoglycan-binding protein)